MMRRQPWRCVSANGAEGEPMKIRPTIWLTEAETATRTTHRAKLKPHRVHAAKPKQNNRSCIGRVSNACVHSIFESVVHWMKHVLLASSNNWVSQHLLAEMKIGVQPQRNRPIRSISSMLGNMVTKGLRWCRAQTLPNRRLMRVWWNSITVAMNMPLCGSTTTRPMAVLDGFSNWKTDDRVTENKSDRDGIELE